MLRCRSPVHLEPNVCVGMLDPLTAGDPLVGERCGRRSNESRGGKDAGESESRE
jgi:hypothetical protein